MQYRNPFRRDRQQPRAAKPAAATDVLDTMPGLREEVARFNGQNTLQQAIRICAGRDPHGLG